MVKRSLEGEVIVCKADAWLLHVPRIKNKVNHCMTSLVTLNWPMNYVGKPDHGQYAGRRRLIEHLAPQVSVVFQMHIICVVISS